MKKKVLLGLNALFLIVSLICAYQIFQIKAKKDLDKSIEQLYQQMDKKYENGGSRKQRGLVGSQLVTAYYPQSEGGDDEAIKVIFDRSIAGLPQEASKDLTGLDFYYTEKESSPFRDVATYTLNLSKVAISKGHLDTEKNQILGQLYLMDDDRPWTLDMLFTDDDQAKALLLEEVQAYLTSIGKEEAQLDNPKNLAEKELYDWEFSYDKGNLLIPISSQDLVSVPLSKLYSVIESFYLTGDDLKNYQAYEEKKNQKLVALTFDDGPSPETTPQALDILAKYNAKATFFMIGENVAGNEELIKRVKKEGHDIANHSWDHPQLTNLTLPEAQKEINDTQEALKKVTGDLPTMMRPPYGAISPEIQNSVDVSFIMWDVDSLDWKTHNTAAIMSEVRKTRPGSIILMHDIHQTTIDALPTVLDYLKTNGYTIVPVSQLLEGQLQPHQSYFCAYP